MVEARKVASRELDANRVTVEPLARCERRYASRRGITIPVKISLLE